MPERPGGGTRPAVLADVAALAGVSSQTVSRVLNGERWVSESTRTRVLEAARTLSYRPNRAARTLATRRSRSIAVVGLDETLFSSISPLVDFERAARREGYNVNVASLTDMSEASMVAALHAVTELSVDGVLVVAPEEGAVNGLKLFPHRIPTVAVEAPAAAGFTTVGLDQVAAARSAVEHLLSLGHERIGLISGPPTRHEARLRQQGWRDALQDAGLTAPQPWMGDWSPASGYAAGRRFLEERDVTAVFASSDHMALGFMRALHEAGLEIPTAVSVVGFDDLREAAFFTPPLTTVRQDFGEVGRVSLELLLARMAAPEEPPAVHVVPTSLVIRDSTAPCPRTTRRQRARLRQAAS